MTVVLQMRKFRSNYLWMCYPHISGAHDPASRSVRTTRAKPQLANVPFFVLSYATIASVCIYYYNTYVYAAARVDVEYR